MNISHGGTHPSVAATVQKSLREILRRFQASPPGLATPITGSDGSGDELEEEDEHGNVPLLHPLQDMGIDDESLPSLLRRCEDVHQRFAQCRQQLKERLPDRLERAQAVTNYRLKLQLRERSALLRTHARESQVLVMKDELRKMKKILKRLEYISSDGVLGLKGKFSCELSTGDELVLTNLIFEGAFNDINGIYILHPSIHSLFDWRRSGSGGGLAQLLCFQGGGQGQQRGLHAREHAGNWKRRPVLCVELNDSVLPSLFSGSIPATSHSRSEHRKVRQTSTPRLLCSLTWRYEAYSWSTG